MACKDNIGSIQLARKFIYGPGIDEPVAMIIPAGLTKPGTYWYHYDGLGSVVALSNSAGAIVVLITKLAIIAKIIVMLLERNTRD